MKTFVITLTTVVLTCLLSPSVVLATDSPDRDRSAQSGTTVVFWTNETSQGPIRVYVNRCYVGTITTSYPSAPRCGAPGCVTVILSRGNNTWYGVAADGTRWFSGNSRLHRGCNSVRLHHAGVSDGNVPVPLPESRHPGSARLECKDLMGPDRGFCRKGVPYLGLDLGASVFYGEFARLIFATGNVSGFYLYGGVGRDIIFDRKILQRIDYILLLTFVAFFIFSVNLRSIESVRTFIESPMRNQPVLSSALVSQIISNVPAAILLSPFTDDFRGVLIGTDIGGLGTPIASLASLISMKFYFRRKEGRKGSYILLFTVLNFALLAVLFLMSCLMLE